MYCFHKIVNFISEVLSRSLKVPMKSIISFLVRATVRPNGPDKNALKRAASFISVCTKVCQKTFTLAIIIQTRCIRGYFPLRPLPGSTVATVDQTWPLFTVALWTQVRQQKRFFPPRDGVDCKKSISLIHYVDPELISPTGDPIK